MGDGPDDALLSSLLRGRFPETTIPYATAAEVAMRHLARGGPFSRQRVGIVLPMGRTAEMKGWKSGERG
ncbi:uncharacterized protein STAUR_4254 [Stigmatella aurantiaca DW4/3-1]|nr:uncharacterized protein STAUR_4254 [Stigmatella aurantiaca DW4/3-1]